MNRIQLSIVPPTAAILLLSGLSAAGVSGQEVKVPRPLPHSADVKTPAPPPLVKEALDLASEPTAQTPAWRPAKNTARQEGQGFLAGLDRDKVYYEQSDDGVLWSAGDRYKASFDESGATYVPFFGSRAPRNFPVHMRIAEIRRGGAVIPFEERATPARSGDRITFDRGIVREIYDLSPASMEQSFVFDGLPGSGDLVVRLVVDSELARETDANGLVLSCEHGSVRYGAASSVDARGVRGAAPTTWAEGTWTEGTWTEGALEIRVPSGRIDGAHFPLTIDPLIATVSVDINPAEDHIQPDVAYDAGNSRWAVVYERAFSATDHDVYMKLFTSGGNFITGDFVDVSGGYWANPKVANNRIAAQFLCVAQVGDPSSGSRIIRGRTIDASSGALGTKFTISNNDVGDLVNPDVGGDPNSAPPTYYCVVWQRILSSTDSDILGRLALADGTLLGTGTMYIENSGSTLDGTPSVSKSDGQSPATEQDWTVVWVRNQSLFDNDLFGAQIHWDGTITAPTFAIETTGANTVTPSVSSPTDASPRRWLVAYARSVALGDVEIFGKLYQGTTLLDTADLTSLSGAPGAETQLLPSVDCDGISFIVANQESYQGTSDYDIYISSFSTIGNQIALGEGYVNLAFNSTVEDSVEVATAGSSGGPLHRTFAAWHDGTAAGNGDIYGAVYNAVPFTQFCAPGADGVIACPCGNFPTNQHTGCNNSAGTGGGRLTATGFVSPDVVVLHATSMLPSATCVFLQGNAMSGGGISFGDGVRCATGALVRLYVKHASGGVADAPVAGDAAISSRSASLGDTILPGQKRWYQTYYRDPANFGCAAPSTFNITSGVQIDW